VAAVALYDGKTLVGEYDPRALSELLRGSGTPIRVVDTGLRVVLSNHGYQAFTELRDRELRAAAASPARAGLVPVGAMGVVDGADAMVAAQRLGADGDPLTALGWVLVAHEDLNAGIFTHNLVGRGAAVVTYLGAGITLVLLGWVYVATVRPLRAAAAHAAAIAATRRGAPPPAPAPAERVDEVGAIITGLNRYLHTVRAAPPSPSRSIPPATAPVATRRPFRPLPVVISAIGPRRVGEDAAASIPFDDQARYPRDSHVVVLAGR